MEKKHRNKGMIKSQIGLNYATFIKLYNVNHNTIGDSKQPKEAKWLEGEWYIKMRDARKKQLNSKNDGPKEWPTFTQKHKPWYFLTKKESKEIQKRHAKKQQTYDEYIDSLVNAKMFKWYRNNPEPEIKKEGMKNMFSNEFIEQWKEKEAVAKERAKKFILSVYDKGNLYGRFLIGKDSYTDGYSIKMGVVSEGKAQKKTNTLRKSHMNLVSTMFKNKRKEKIFIPKDESGEMLLPELKKVA